MTSQNNDSGVDVNVGGNDADSDGDIIVDENPLPGLSAGSNFLIFLVKICNYPNIFFKHNGGQ